ncbi:uncharacterized protein N7525_009514 [Penicillium rubens]|uniref:uncharacterized protein n=1 Tax=Penicillium rubens TaxID=1108849 RepID=UPI002A5AA3E0|nr:uncharacterized protein N7525_009514 [Penicillium rubens]KAJ5831261.1 hypothetical protein N7525_009514 [Penicillium rubens]
MDQTANHGRIAKSTKATMSDQPVEGLYWSLLQSTLQQQYPEFVQHLSEQEGSMGEEGQAAVIEFWDNAKPSVRNLATSRELTRCLDESHPTDVVRRRVFVLEGLPKNFIQVLGARLKVPPAFFASHWTVPGSVTGSILNQHPRHYNRQDRFALKFPKLHRARIKALEGDDRYPFYSMESSVHRPLSCITVFGDFDGPLSSFEQLSFWGKCDEKSWDTIPLVDPPLGNFVSLRNSSTPREVDHDASIKLVGSKIDALDQRGSWYPFYPSTAVLGQNSADWKNAEQSPTMESMFKDILLLYSLMERHLTADMNKAQIIQEQCRMSIGNMAVEMSAANLFENSWAQPWHPRDFGRLVRAKTALESVNWELYRNMDALGIFSKADTTEDWESDAWRSLQHVVQNLMARLDIISQAYTQAVPVRESISSNKQAQQVGYLTSLATVFIPISFVAAVFSMGGDFSAGASHFWVYWVIAVPVVAVGCLLLFTNFGRWILGNISAEESLV